MEPVTIVVLGLALIGGGFFAGRATNKQTVEALEAQAQILEQQSGALVALQESAGKPVIIDAELRSQLAQIPPACLPDLGGDPEGPACLLVTCWAFTQTSAQRPECGDLQDELIAFMVQDWKIRISESGFRKSEIGFRISDSRDEGEPAAAQPSRSMAGD